MSDPNIGAIEWRDLTIDNAEQVKDFYRDVVGWKTEPVSMGDYDDFNMIDAEQYFSAESSTARLPCISFNCLPATTKCRWILVKGEGTACARSAFSSTRQSVTCCRALCKLLTTSNEAQPPKPSSSISMGRTPILRPP